MGKINHGYCATKCLLSYFMYHRYTIDSVAPKKTVSAEFYRVCLIDAT